MTENNAVSGASAVTEVVRDSWTVEVWGQDRWYEVRACRMLTLDHGEASRMLAECRKKDNRRYRLAHVILTREIECDET
jgi:hypothetical protein